MGSRPVIIPQSDMLDSAVRSVFETTTMYASWPCPPFAAAAIVVASVIAGGEARAQQTSAAETAPSGFYVGMTGGVQSREIGVEINLVTAAEWSTGFGISPVFGYRAPANAWRLELEWSTLDNNNVGFYFPPYPNGPREESAGHVTLRSLMANFYYDIHLTGRAARLKPYFGGGIGGTESRISGVTTATLSAGIPGVFPPTVLDTASRFTRSWQVRFGAGFQVTDRVEVFGGYRHFETDLLKFKTTQFPDMQTRGANVEQAEAGVRIFIRR
jgi:opacity protein-like surface antigen